MTVNLTGNEGKVIPYSDAKEMYKNYSTLDVGISSDEVKSLIFGKNQILALINQAECSGVRIYFGLKKEEDELEPELMLVAINRKGQDIKNSDGVLSEGVPCPKICPSNGL